MKVIAETNAETPKHDAEEIAETPKHVNLGKGWKAFQKKRCTGASKGQKDWYYIDPKGKQFRSITVAKKFWNKSDWPKHWAAGV